jgi:hypothetical protein
MTSSPPRRLPFCGDAGAWWTMLPILLAAVLAAPPLPAEVARFVQRAEQCHHWAGEEPYDAERAAWIEAAVNRLRCEALPAHAKRLKRRHARRPQALRAIERALKLSES